MRLTLCFVFVFCMVQNACQPATESTDNSSENTTTTSTTSDEEVELEEEVFRDLSEDQSKGLFEEAVEVNVLFDPVFKTPKRYEAIPFVPYLKKVLEEEQLDTTDLELIFICKDGYNPSMRVSKVLAYQPYMAIRDLDAPEGKMWMDTLNGLWSPFYLVWTTHDKGAKGFHWPYGLSFMRLINASAEFKDLFPYDDAAMVPKFNLFKEKCLKCHPMNGIGGVMGPEFNSPKNITEYWTREDIIAFSKNPQSYRSNAKMAPLSNMTDRELNDVVDYLEYMKERK